MTESQRKECEDLIDTAYKSALAAGAISEAAVKGVQVIMVLNLADIFNVSISKTVAIAYVESLFNGETVIMEVARWLIPPSRVLTAIQAAEKTKDFGWRVAKKFDKESSQKETDSEINRNHYQTYIDNGEIVKSCQATRESLIKLGNKKISIMKNNMKDFVDNFSRLKKVNFRNSVMLDELRDFNLNYEQDIKNLYSAMNETKGKSDTTHDLLVELDKRFGSAIDHMKNAIRYFGTDFSKFSQVAQNDVFKAAQLAQTIKKVIDTPLMNQQGGVSYEAQNLLTSREVKVLLD